MPPYVYNQAIILTDSIYSNYGGVTGSSLPAQRAIAYWLAEQVVSEDLETYLLPTIVTGTFAYNPRLILEHTYVTQVHLLRFYDVEERLYWTISGTANVYASLRDNGEYGLVDLHQVMANCGGCGAHGMIPYKIQAVYTAGLSSGTSYQPNVLLALTMMAKIVINEIIGFGNEAPGDIGVQSYSNQNYRETRVALLKTTFGSSAQAQFIKKLLTSLSRKRYVGL
jgi:hypothetical protein